MAAIGIHPEVADALRGGRPVVALESAVITSGLPREPLPPQSQMDIAGWNAGSAVNLELGRAMERAVRASGAVPAMIAIVDGTLRIGLDDADLVRLAEDREAGKAAVNDLAHCLGGGDPSRAGRSFGTTVSATLAACAVAQTASQSKIQNPKSKIAPIRVFATGGIGGVHRGWQRLPDVSADLRAIGSTPVCVVCAGAKSILDLPATLEALESLGVPVIGYRTNVFPQFQCRGDDTLKLSKRVDDAAHAARVCRMHWNALGLRTGIILANPVGAEHAMERRELESAVEAAERAAIERGIGGAGRTPFLLGEVARLTRGRSLHANLALLLGNARLAAEVAAAMATKPGP